MFHGDLRQEQSSRPAANDEESVPADFDLFRKNRLRRRKHGDFDQKIWNFLRYDGRKAVILQRSQRGASRDGFRQRIARFRLADAAAQFSARTKRDERAARIGECSDHGTDFEIKAARDGGDDRASCDVQ